MLRWHTSTRLDMKALFVAAAMAALCVWHVPVHGALVIDPLAPSGGDGSLNSPFSSFDDLTADSVENGESLAIDVRSGARTFVRTPLPGHRLLLSGISSNETEEVEIFSSEPMYFDSVYISDVIISSTAAVSLVDASTITMRGVTLEAGSSQALGGCVVLRENGLAVIEASIFRNCGALFGGAIAALPGSSLDVFGSSFTSNVATLDAPVAFLMDVMHAAFDGCTFETSAVSGVERWIVTHGADSEVELTESTFNGPSQSTYVFQSSQDVCAEIALGDHEEVVNNLTCEIGCVDGYEEDEDGDCVGCPDGVCTQYDASGNSCGPVPAFATWDARVGCEWTCDEVAYEQGGQCVACSASGDCADGTILVGVCGDYSGPSCVPCSGKPGFSAWVGSGVCAWECDDGYYVSGSGGSGCERCSVCGTGSVEEDACGATTDTVCVECTKPDFGVFVSGFEACAWECLPGFVESDDGGDCVECEKPDFGVFVSGFEACAWECLPGFVEDTLLDDCVECEKPDFAVYVGVGGDCAWECLPGFVVSGDDLDCVECEKPDFGVFVTGGGDCAWTCLPGFVVSDDGLDCVECEKPDYSLFVSGGQECSWECVPGFFADGDVCTVCGECGIGEMEVSGCSATGDVSCTACGPAVVNGAWGAGCTVECDDGSYYDGDVDGCVACSSGCAVDEREVLACGVDHDVVCVPCQVVANSVFVADVESCSVLCNDGFFLEDTFCEQCTPCEYGSVEATACNATHDRTCNACAELPPVDAMFVNGTCDFECIPAAEQLSEDGEPLVCSRLRLLGSAHRFLGFGDEVYTFVGEMLSDAVVSVGGGLRVTMRHDTAVELTGDGTFEADVTFSFPNGGVYVYSLRSGSYADLASTYTCTGGAVDFVVPDGVYHIGVELIGAGGQHATATNNAMPGVGGYARGYIDVVPGDSLLVYVGCTSSFPDGGAGASSGQGSSGNGGGSSSVRTMSGDPILVGAGGGGGGLHSQSGGNGANGGGLEGCTPCHEPATQLVGGNPNSCGTGGDGSFGGLFMGGDGGGVEVAGGGGGGGGYVRW